MILCMPQTAPARRKSLYSVHPGVEATQKWVATLPEKTGRTLDEWIQLVKNSGPRTEKERHEWLKTKHKLGTNAAWWIAERAEGLPLPDHRPAVSPSRLRANQAHHEHAHRFRFRSQDTKPT